MHSGLKLLNRLIRGRMPGQLVIQITDRCNASCPQCGMRTTNQYARTRLSLDRLKKIIDAAGEKGFQAISFTGGEPMLLRKDLLELISHAGRAGIPYIRTGTNGFFFMDHDRPDFLDKIKKTAEELAATPLRNFWISLDSPHPRVHESMRGLNGVVRGMEKALPVFHEVGLFPSVNLGINRNLTPATQALAPPSPRARANPKASVFYQTFAKGFAVFYQKAIDLGFTIVNACYPMSMDTRQIRDGLEAVYPAAAPDRIVCFDRNEKALVFKALMDTIPAYRSKIRIFSPRTTLHTLCQTYSGKPAHAFGCRGGIDFFYVNCVDGNTYPCGFRGSDNLGPFWELDLNSLDKTARCLACDWECFRDPTELGGPVIDGIKNPLRLALGLTKNPPSRWIEDLRYYKACDFFNGRKAPNFAALTRF